MKKRSQNEVDSWCSHFEERCRERGIRVTPQRLAVYRALAADASHPTAELVHGRLRSGMSSLSLATVYRILEFLESERLVRRVSTTDSVSRFDANLARHHHLVCRLCGSMKDLEEMPSVRVPFAGIAPRGFAVEQLDIHIVGTCASCRRASVKRRPTNSELDYRQKSGEPGSPPTEDNDA
jgi:Fur family peroxide stress response transcriptional regulator